MRYVYFTPPLQHDTPPPPSAMPCLLQEYAGRWYHRFACLVLTIEVYVRVKHLTKVC